MIIKECTIVDLTQRERQVLNGAVQGKMNKVLAHELCLSIKTIEMYRARLRKKYNVNSMAELIVITLQQQQEN